MHVPPPFSPKLRETCLPVGRVPNRGMRVWLIYFLQFLQVSKIHRQYYYLHHYSKISSHDNPLILKILCVYHLFCHKILLHVINHQLQQSISFQNIQNQQYNPQSDIVYEISNLKIYDYVILPKSLFLVVSVFCEDFLPYLYFLGSW